jgi:hypothetical protein
MMRCTVVIVSLAAAGVIGVVPAADAVSGESLAKSAKSTKVPPAGTSYFAPTTPAGGLALVVSRDLREVRRTVFAYQAPCTDGSRGPGTYDVLAPFPIAANRTFRARFDSGPQTSPKYPGLVVQTKISISGAINKSRSRIVGTARAITTITGVAGSDKCDTGLVVFTATD